MLDKTPHIVSINTSPGGIPKVPVNFTHVSVHGLAGDGHNHEKHRTTLQAVCLQDIEKLEELNREGYQLVPGATGENLTVANLNVNALPVGTVLNFSNGVVVELTKVRKPCYVLDAISQSLKNDILGRCGIYAKVIRDGFLTEGETISVVHASASSLSCPAS
ncbi:MAG: MOSC domain-containing protein [Candidatus Omnitrophica bacterium]|nr:MOSC domain-containing protein [Candidatus Omnitrophota bacterium]